MKKSYWEGNWFNTTFNFTKLFLIHHLLKNLKKFIFVPFIKKYIFNYKKFYWIPMKILTEMVIFENSHKNFIYNFGLNIKIFK